MRIDKRNLLRISAVVLALILFTSGFLLLKQWEARQGRFPEWTAEDEIVQYNGVEYILKENVETLLILGLDKFGEEDVSDSYNNDRQADFLMLFVFDNDTQTCTAIHINRDTMADIDVLGLAGQRVNTITKQIALAHTYGNGREVSCRNTANAVSRLLKNVDVDHYVSVTMEAVSVYNDLIGGVTLKVLDDFSDVESTLVKGETVTLTGDLALTYIRTRAGMEDPTNSARMRRQKQYMEALYAQTQIAVESDNAFYARVAQSLSGSMVSDCSGNKLEILFNRIARYQPGGILEIAGESKMGDQFLEFHPDENSIVQIVIDCFYRERE